jgi:hypothetical protein
MEQNTEAFDRLELEVTNIASEDLGPLKFLAALLQPVSVEFWSQQSCTHIEDLVVIIQKYKLLRNTENKIFPISIEKSDLHEQHGIIAKNLLSKWKNRNK